MRKKRREAAKVAVGAVGAIKTDVEGHAIVAGGAEDYSLTLPVILELGQNLSLLLKKGKGTPNLVEELIPKMRQALYQDMGVRYPGVHVRTESPSLDEDEYSILLNEVLLVRGKIPRHYLLTNELEENPG